MTASDYDRARRLLARRDPLLGGLIRRHGACGLAAARPADPFTALAHAIMAQQLSSKAAAAIARRFDALFEPGRPSAAALAALPDERLRDAGISPQKRGYLRDLVSKVRAGALALDRLDGLPDDEVIRELTAVKGIGRWTAEMFLIFHLRRPDILPLGDLGILRAVQRVYGLRTPPTPVRLVRIGESWRPYRSVACWYLWASLDGVPA